MEVKKEYEIVLGLIRVALGHPNECFLQQGTNWVEVMDIASKQGVIGICFDAFDLIRQNLAPNCMPDRDTLLNWVGQVLYMESRYDEHRKAIGELAHFYDGQGIKLMVMKGYGLSLNYPKPEHRPMGDVDSYNFGLQEAADQMMCDELGIVIDNSHHRHSVFVFHGVTVENHYNFIDDCAHWSNKRFETLLKAEVDMDCEVVEVDGQMVYLPSARFNSLFLLKHCAGHFAATEMTLRQLLDWLLFVRKYHNKVDWSSVYGIYRNENLDKYANTLNAIGVKYLGFERSIFYEVSNNDELTARVLNDILAPEFAEKEDGTLLRGLCVKPRRWWHNRWKHKICYPDNLFVDFCLNLYSKILKPAHIRF